MLTAVLGTAGSEAGGLQVKSICAALAGPDFKSFLKSALGDGSRPQALLKRPNLVHIPTESYCHGAQKQLGATSKLGEKAILDLVDKTPQVNAAVSVAILSVLFAKWRNSPSQQSGHIASNVGPNLGAGSVLQQMDQWFEPTLTWPDALQHLIEPFIVDQHNRVMFEKGKLESCWLHRVEDKVIKDQDYSPGFRASRHRNCVSIMNDLGLLDVDNDRATSLTREGRQALSRVLR